MASLAKSFEEMIGSLPDDWTDLELDLRIFDERRYAELRCRDLMRALTRRGTTVAARPVRLWCGIRTKVAPPPVGIIGGRPPSAASSLPRNASAPGG